jgi:hypothetical protein
MISSIPSMAMDMISPQSDALGATAGRCEPHHHQMQEEYQNGLGRTNQKVEERSARGYLTFIRAKARIFGGLKGMIEAVLFQKRFTT